MLKENNTNNLSGLVENEQLIGTSNGKLNPIFNKVYKEHIQFPLKMSQWFS